MMQQLIIFNLLKKQFPKHLIHGSLKKHLDFTAQNHTLILEFKLVKLPA